jgi:hypothetical protein
MHKLQLLVLDSIGAEVYTDFWIDFESINGYYLDPDDASQINIVVFGTSFTVKQDVYLTGYLQFDTTGI